MTSSLYVPGKLNLGNSKLLVDIGTGYYVEKSAGEATEYYKRKCEYLASSIENLNNAIDAKSVQIRAVQNIMQQKATATTAATKSS